jgi:integrase
MKFTSQNVKKITPPLDPETGKIKSDYTEWDDANPGFGVRIRDGGQGVFVIQYFLNGKPRKMSLGKVMKVPLDAALIEAKQHFASIANKDDPHAARQKKVAKAGEMFNAKIEKFLEWQAKEQDDRPARTPNYISAQRHSLNVHFKALHRYSLGDITRKTIVEELDTIAEETPRAAGIARAHLSAYYGFLQKKGYEGFNPCDGTETRKSKPRNRVLDPAELALIWKATEGDDDYDVIIRLIMLTGMRKTVIGSMKRAEYNLETRIIDVPIEVGKAKNKKRFWAALSPRAQAILSKVIDRRKHSDFVFGDGGEGGFSGWSKAKDALDRRIAELNGGVPIPHWVLHDLRRSFYTLGVDKAKIDDRIADICLYHVGEHKKGVKRNYNHADHLDEKHRAMKQWADYLDKVFKTKPDLKTVENQPQEVAAQ